MPRRLVTKVSANHVSIKNDFRGCLYEVLKLQLYDFQVLVDNSSLSPKLENDTTVLCTCDAPFGQCFQDNLFWINFARVELLNTSLCKA